MYFVIPRATAINTIQRDTFKNTIDELKHNVKNVKITQRK